MNEARRVLAGDVGGTKTVLALCDPRGNDATIAYEQVYPSSEFTSFSAVLERFRRDAEFSDLDGACLGVAGAVLGGHVSTTNLPWTLDEDELCEVLGTETRLLNDLEASAVGTLHLRSEDQVVLQPGSLEFGNIAVLAAGTGLGESFLVWDRERFLPVATEGGHADFAAQTPEQVDLLRFLQRDHDDPISNEHILCGAGLSRIHQFLTHERSGAAPPLSPAEVSRAGLAETDPDCGEALRLFAEIYAQEAANLALRTMARGGVFIAGGIAPKILPVLQRQDFLDRFQHKARFGDFLASLRLSVVTDERLPLKGAAHFAANHATLV